ncbi:MAG: hypothetical protein PHS57_08670 [Alphaproteobacteria bacterium]|nr:hypothetical protein [Alphaproteobacteria bacterium]
MGIPFSDLVNVGRPLDTDFLAVLRGTEVVRTQMPKARLGGVSDIYVSPSGSDETGDGTESSPWLTLQKAADFAYQFCDALTTVHVADGVYTTGCTTYGHPDGDTRGIIIAGNDAHPENVHLNCVGNCLTTSGGYLAIKGIKMSSTNGSALTAAAAGRIRSIGAVEFGACPNGFHTISGQSSSIELGQSYKISGGARSHLYMWEGGTVSNVSVTVTLVNTPNFTYSFAGGYNCGNIAAWGTTYVGAATGTRYYVYNNATINVAGGGANYFPGSVAGSYASGGSYA